MALAGATGVVVVLLEPGLTISGVITRTEIWLLAVFVEGVLALLGGLSLVIGGLARSRGVRDLTRDEYRDAAKRLEYRDAAKRLEDRDASNRRVEPDAGHRPLRWDGVPWVTALGLCLLGIYSVGWLATRT